MIKCLKSSINVLLTVFTQYMSISQSESNYGIIASHSKTICKEHCRVSKMVLLSLILPCINTMILLVASRFSFINQKYFNVSFVFLQVITSYFNEIMY